MLVKASAGGGGRGMRVVRDLDALARRPSSRRPPRRRRAFGDATVFCEPYVERGRHIEVQVMGDMPRRRSLVLGERDCSLQRRHQKVVEEAPAPGHLRRAAARRCTRPPATAAEAVGYVGAGTVEFLARPATASRFFFLEMNTRLQVEHPVTECVTGLDLVALQIAVAEGRALAELVPEPLPVEGHAVEVRLYAEDPAHDWQPQSGRLSRFEVPGVARRVREPCRRTASGSTPA